MIVRPPGLIEIRLTQASQLFNSMDPSPFHERDLDHDAEEYIVSWAREVHEDHPFRLRIVLREAANPEVARFVRESIRHYFDYRTAQYGRDLRKMLREGRSSLFIGLAFLAATLALASMIKSDAGWASLLREGLTICGWVGMWRPIEIHLYRWWPIRRDIILHRKLSEADVEVVFEPN
jgi:hypothetical protein